MGFMYLTFGMSFSKSVIIFIWILDNYFLLDILYFLSDIVNAALNIQA